MKLQLALDDITLEKAITLIAEVKNFIDIIEIGTPMIIEYGMLALRTIKEKYPDKEILADTKIMDGGAYEANQAFAAGADYITVLGVSDNLTIQACVEVAKKYGKQVVIDMICVGDLVSRIHTMEELNVDYVSVHVGVDQQAIGRTPLDDLKIMKETLTRAKVSVAGGISIDTIDEYCKLTPDVVIVGSHIVHANNPKEIAHCLFDKINK